MGVMSMVSRMMPYPPSFRRSAASSMDPAMGASTWALGSHRWSPYKGAFTMNAVSRARLDRRPVQETVRTGWVSFRIMRCRVPVCVCKWRMATSRGRELIRV